MSSYIPIVTEQMLKKQVKNCSHGVGVLSFSVQLGIREKISRVRINFEVLGAFQAVLDLPVVAEVRVLSHNSPNLRSGRQIFPDVGQDGGGREERSVVVDILDVDRHRDGSGELRRPGIDGHHGQLDGVAGLAVEGAGQGEVAGVRIEMKLEE